MKTRLEIAELAAVLARQRPRDVKAVPSHLIAKDTLLIARIAASASNEAVKLCNVPDYQPLFDCASKRLLKRLGSVSIRYGVRFNIGGDPRGFALWMHSASQQIPIRGNTMGGDQQGYGI